MTEDEDICKGCGKEFLSREETEKHELTCKILNFSVVDKTMMSESRYPMLESLCSIYKISGYLVLTAGGIASIYTAYNDEALWQAIYYLLIGIIGYIVAMSTSELIKLFMDIQNNTYLATELNLAMAKSIEDISESLKKKGD